jgi:hypothetical protein
MVDMNKVERNDDMQNSRSAGENVLASAPSHHSRSAGENVLVSSPSQQDDEGVPAVFSFKKLRAAESSRVSETTTTHLESVPTRQVPTLSLLRKWRQRKIR